MRRKPFACDLCHNMPTFDKPLTTMYDGSLMLCPACFRRELEHRKQEELNL